MSSKLRILILGIGQSNFLNQLYASIHHFKGEDKFDFSINSYREFSKKSPDLTFLPYEQFLDFQFENPSQIKFKKALFKFSKTKFFWKSLFCYLVQGLSWRDIKRKLGDLAKTKFVVDNEITPLDFDIIHFHYCIPENLSPIYFFNRKAKVICSFWGSDLLRSDGVENYFFVRAALERADKITVQTMEMAELLFCKFGRKFKDKLKTLRFTLSKDIFNEINDCKTDSELISRFKKKFAIPEDKLIIALGHNGFSQNNHVLMLNEIAKLSDKEMEYFHFIIHASYGANQAYLTSLKERNISNLNIITEFFDPKEIALLRLSTDLLVQMPTTDALSAAMTEILYCGNSVVCGAWLPYGFLRRKGVNYYELEDFADLKQFLLFFKQKLETIKLDNIENKNLIIANLFPEVTTPEWIKLFKDI